MTNLCSHSKPNLNDQYLGIIGDSGTTGAASDPHISADVWTLTFNGLNGITMMNNNSDDRIQLSSQIQSELNINPKLIPPTRIWQSSQEKSNSKSMINKIKLMGEQLDIEEHSFGYLIGNSLHIRPSHILFASQDGAKAESLYHQFNRLKDAVFGYLPQRVIISYTGNDMCSEDIMTTEPTLLGDRYYKIFKRELQKVFSESKVHPQGTTIYILANLNLIQVLHNSEILEKKVPFQGGNISCRNMREGNTNRNILGLVPVNFAKSLNGMCTAILKTHPLDQKRIHHLIQIHSSYVDAQKQVVQDLSAEAKFRGIELVFISETAEILFSKEDVANDCFHPSHLAHIKIARKLQKYLRTN